MRKVAALGLAFGLMAGSNAFAGLASFSPISQDVIVNSGAQIEMDVTIQTQTLPSFDTADIILFGDVPFSFAYSPEFTALATAALTPIAGVGIMPNDLYVGGASATAGAFGNSILLGTVTINTAGLVEDTYSIQVSSDADGGITTITRQGSPEGVIGSGSFTVVPEPASLGLLGLGALGLLRRRFVG